MNLLNYQQFHLVGIKGVAMTSLAQILISAGKTVTGCDVAEEFVTQPILKQLKINITHDFQQQYPAQTNCVIYTSAHGGPHNPQVELAQQNGVATYSQAEALSELFNSQQGIAVCGVGGKTTTSAMLALILQNSASNQNNQPSFSVGVGNIPGLDKTGQWNPQAKYFVAEADEYVIDPAANPKTPRFSFLKPFITVCTNIKYDHPDVYSSLADTLQTYQQFFTQIKEGGTLILNRDDPNFSKIDLHQINQQTLTYGFDDQSDLQILSYAAQTGTTTSQLKFKNKTEQGYQLTLHVPGKYNVYNAAAAILAADQLGVDPQQSIDILKNFKGTQRRFQLIGNKNGVTYYDDYAHHPDEITSALAALAEWYPDHKKIVAFQAHTYSRTKELFEQFVTSFEQADQLVMLDIFSSAREKNDPSVSSDLLCQQINQKYPHLQAQNLHQLDQLASFLKTNTHPGDVVITLGAGDIYKVHDMIS